MDLTAAARLLCAEMKTALAEKRGFLVGRNGTGEMDCLLADTYTHFIGKEQRMVLERNAGVFPTTAESVRRWIVQTTSAIRATDCLVAGWYAPLQPAETIFLNTLGARKPYLPLRALEPYYEADTTQRWTTLLAGRRVAIVSSFAETAVRQVERRTALWGAAADSLLPADTTWLPVRTGYAPVLAAGRAEWPGLPATWQAAVESVVQRVLDLSAEIVLIGCGGLGMIIGERLKRSGRICIVMGGAIQVLFGIKGRRWAKHPIISKFWNDAWVYPPLEETPGAAHTIEGGCYWGTAPTAKN